MEAGDCPVELLWFDSMGAKSSSILIKGGECDILVDPGAAEMQPSYPLSASEKQRLRDQALYKIKTRLTSKKTRVVIITHYHYDHHPRPESSIIKPRDFTGKIIIAKNPNIFINESQWKRARVFYEAIAKIAGVEDLYQPVPSKIQILNPEEGLREALSKDYGDYTRRKRELLEKGRRWFEKLKKLWFGGPWIGELASPEVKVIWADYRRINVCGVELAFTPPWFHGVEYDRTGWIVGFQAIVDGCRLFYSSDVMGPIIEDYAVYIASSRPDLIVLDGPPTYLFPYMLNRINLERAVSNAIRIMKNGPRLIIYDHHLLREKRWRQRVRRVFEASREYDVPVLTAAEVYGMKPLIDRL